eukprot:scpid44045/ scgid33369/ 
MHKLPDEAAARYCVALLEIDSKRVILTLENEKPGNIQKISAAQEYPILIKRSRKHFEVVSATMLHCGGNKPVIQQTETMLVPVNSTRSKRLSDTHTALVINSS